MWKLLTKTENAITKTENGITKAEYPGKKGNTKYDKTYYHENGTFPFSFFRITKTRIQKFSVLSLTDPDVEAIDKVLNTS